MIQIDESFVDAAAPNAAAIKNGKALVIKGKFVKLSKSEDESARLCVELCFDGRIAERRPRDRRLQPECEHFPLLPPEDTGKASGTQNLARATQPPRAS